MVWSSISTGKVTVSSRLHSRSTRAMFGSRPSTLAAISNCSWAIVHGFDASGTASAKPLLGTASTFWAMIPPAVLRRLNSLTGRSAPITLHGTVTPRMTVLASVSLATFLVAGMAATQFRSQPLPPSNRLARDEALRQSVNQLEDQNRALKARNQGLQAQVKAGEDESANRSSAVQQVNAQLDDQRVIAGLTPLHGPGLTITLHDGADPNDPADKSLGWTIHYQDLQDIVNILWASGAEAVAVNGQRVGPKTAFHYG